MSLNFLYSLHKPTKLPQLQMKIFVFSSFLIYCVLCCLSICKWFCFSWLRIYSMHSTLHYFNHMYLVDLYLCFALMISYLVICFPWSAQCLFLSFEYYPVANWWSAFSSPTGLLECTAGLSLSLSISCFCLARVKEWIFELLNWLILNKMVPSIFASPRLSNSGKSLIALRQTLYHQTSWICFPFRFVD